MKAEVFLGQWEASWACYTCWLSWTVVIATYMQIWTYLVLCKIRLSDGWEQLNCPEVIFVRVIALSSNTFHEEGAFCLPGLPDRVQIRHLRQAIAGGASLCCQLEGPGIIPKAWWSAGARSASASCAVLLWL